MALPEPGAESGMDLQIQRVAIHGTTDDLQRRLFEALGCELVSLEHVVKRFNAPAKQVNAALLTLELEGQVVTSAGTVFSRPHRHN